MEGDTPTGRICFTVGTGKDEITEDTFLKGLKPTNVGQYNNRTFYDDSFKTKLSWSRESVTVQAGSAPVPVRIGFAPGPKLAKNLPPPKILKATENYVTSLSLTSTTTKSSRPCKEQAQPSCGR